MDGQKKAPAMDLPRQRLKLKHFRMLLGLGLVFITFTISQLGSTTTFHHHHHRAERPQHASSILSRCRQLKVKAGPPSDFHSRSHSERFEAGTRPVLVRNAQIWTGKKNGTEVIHGDILLDKGIIKSIGHLSSAELLEFGKELMEVDAKGAWATPGIVDIHSHLGDAASPALDGAEDDNSLKGTIQPWLRSLDGLNTHDDSYPLSIAGGVTTSLVLPGSANAIGTYLALLRRSSLLKSFCRRSSFRYQASRDQGEVTFVYVA